MAAGGAPSKPRTRDAPTCRIRPWQPGKKHVFLCTPQPTFRPYDFIHVLHDASLAASWWIRSGQQALGLPDIRSVSLRPPHAKRLTRSAESPVARLANRYTLSRLGRSRSRRGRGRRRLFLNARDTASTWLVRVQKGAIGPMQRFCSDLQPFYKLI